MRNSTELSLSSSCPAARLSPLRNFVRMDSPLFAFSAHMEPAQGCRGAVGRGAAQCASRVLAIVAWRVPGTAATDKRCCCCCNCCCRCVVLPCVAAVVVGIDVGIVAGVDDGLCTPLKEACHN
eukprot:366278-Chlamydomonas_euryale.AAC.63